MKLVAYDPTMLTLKGGPRMVPKEEPEEPETGPQGEPLPDDDGEEPVTD
jgi:hypothetical protein